MKHILADTKSVGNHCALEMAKMVDRVLGAGGFVAQVTLKTLVGSRKGTTADGKKKWPRGARQIALSCETNLARESERPTVKLNYEPFHVTRVGRCAYTQGSQPSLLVQAGKRTTFWPMGGDALRSEEYQELLKGGNFHIP